MSSIKHFKSFCLYSLPDMTRKSMIRLKYTRFINGFEICLADWHYLKKKLYSAFEQGSYYTGSVAITILTDKGIGFLFFEDRSMVDCFTFFSVFTYSNQNAIITLLNRWKLKTIIASMYSYSLKGRKLKAENWDFPFFCKLWKYVSIDYSYTEEHFIGHPVTNCKYRGKIYFWTKRQVLTQTIVLIRSFAAAQSTVVADWNICSGQQVAKYS